MEMMYRRIGDAIAVTGHDSKPTDWLVFLCPGKREESGEHLDELDEPTDPLAQVRL